MYTYTYTELENLIRLTRVSKNYATARDFHQACTNENGELPWQKACIQAQR